MYFCCYYRAERSVIKSNIDHLIDRGLGEFASKDFGFAADACYVLSMLGQRVDVSDLIIRKIIEIYIYFS